MTKYYRQCSMRRKIAEDIYKLHVAWIPDKHAKVGKYIKIKLDDGTWEDGWEITAVWTKKDAKFVEDGERDYKKQRKASDI